MCSGSIHWAVPFIRKSYYSFSLGYTLLLLRAAPDDINISPTTPQRPQSTSQPQEHFCCSSERRRWNRNKKTFPFKSVVIILKLKSGKNVHLKNFFLLLSAPKTKNVLHSVKNDTECKMPQKVFSYKNATVVQPFVCAEQNNKTRAGTLLKKLIY